uniref:PPM-type phosphatase domain-containing protein n=1 Tax=Lotharella globosa TaxID=91324 RepID=A0A6V3Q9X3_9EUKA
MNELHRLGVISHVTNDHVVEDKEYFYRLEEAALKAEPGAPSVAMCPASTLPQDEISSAFLSVDAIAQKEEKYQTCGSTAINLFVVAGETGSRSILCAWTGDSRAAYFSGSDLHEFGHLSNDHDPTSVAERRRIDQYGKEKGGAFVARRTTQGGALGPWAVFKNTPEVGGLSLMMTRSIGDARHSKAIVPDPEFKRIQVGRQEIVRCVVASDGMWRVLNANAVRSHLTKNTHARTHAHTHTHTHMTRARARAHAGYQQRQH